MIGDVLVPQFYGAESPYLHNHKRQLTYLQILRPLLSTDSLLRILGAGGGDGGDGASAGVW